MLHLAASTSEADVEAALLLLAESGRLATFEAVREVVRTNEPPNVPNLERPPLDLERYDALLGARSGHG